MRMHEGHCAQLCASGDGQALCSVYELRPEACRAFRAGSFECKQAIRHNGPLAEALRAPRVPPGAPPPQVEPELPAAHIVDPSAPKGRFRPGA